MDVRKLADKLCLKPAALYMWFSEKRTVEELLDGVLK